MQDPVAIAEIGHTPTHTHLQTLSATQLPPTQPCNGGNRSLRILYPIPRCTLGTIMQILRPPIICNIPYCNPQDLITAAVMLSLLQPAGSHHSCHDAILTATGRISSHLPWCYPYCNQQDLFTAAVTLSLLQPAWSHYSCRDIILTAARRISSQLPCLMLSLLQPAGSHHSCRDAILTATRRISSRRYWFYKT